MGFFDKFTETSTAKVDYKPLNDYEAWVCILYACMISDGDDSEVEINCFSDLLLRKKKFYSLELSPFYKIAIQTYLEIGAESLVKACAPFINEEDKPTLFAMCVELVLTDGLLTESEKHIIEFIANNLSIDEELVDRIIEVMLIKNKGNIIIN